MDFVSYIVIILFPVLLLVGVFFGITRVRRGKGFFLLIVFLLLSAVYGYYLYKIATIKQVPPPAWNKLCPPGAVINAEQTSCDIVE